MLNVVVACAMGAGSSLMMKMRLQEVFKELGVEASVYHCQISEAASTAARYDAVFTALNFVGNFERAKQAGVPVIGIKNIMSAQEMKQKILESGLLTASGK